MKHLNVLTDRLASLLLPAVEARGPVDLAALFNEVLLKCFHNVIYIHIAYVSSNVAKMSLVLLPMLYSMVQT